MNRPPLDGVTVLDLSRALAGPYCSALLADLGASIIKVESLNGDTARAWPPFEGEHSLYFDSINRNKRSICLDVYSEDGKRLLRSLVAGADVLLENFKTGTLAKLGLDQATLDELNPDLIVASVTGFGETGPLADAAGLDQVVQGMSGLVSVTGEDADRAVRVGVPIIDITSGMTIAISILAALYGRTNGAPVHRVATSLLETGLSLGVFQAQRALSTGAAAAPQGNAHPSIAPYGVYRTATVPITIAAANERHWRALCELIGAPSLLDDPRFADGKLRLEHRAALTAELETQLRKGDGEAWVERIREAGIPCGPIYDYTEALATEQVAALELIEAVERGDGTELPLLRGPIRVDGARASIASAPPLLGEHTHEVLAELGLDATAIADLEARGSVRSVSAKVSGRASGADPRASASAGIAPFATADGHSA